MTDLFKTAPAETLRYFRTKKSTPTFDWRDVAPEEHAFAWTVAKSTEHDVLEDIRAATDDAVTNRVPFEEFQKRLTPILQEKGWWGRKAVTDPKDGSDKVVQLGSPRRLKIIYWANTRTAYAAGEWERTKRTERFLPFLMYTLSHAEHKRPEHESWVGTVLPVNDPWWNTHYPPNAWGCECGVRQITQRDAERRGWSEGKKAPSLDLQPWTNKRTGETSQVPKGIAPGWATNPGKTRAANVSSFLTDSLVAIPENRQRIAIEDILGSPILKAMAEKRMPKASYMPVAQVPDAALKSFSAAKAVARLSSESVDHILNAHSERGLSVDNFRQAIAVISNPSGIIRKGRGVILFGFSGDGWWRLILKHVEAKQEWWLTSLHRKSEQEAQRILRKAEEDGTLLK